MENKRKGVGMFNYLRRATTGLLVVASLAVPGAVLPTQAADHGYHASWVNQNGYPILAPGQSYKFEVRLRNTGWQTWHRGRVNLGTDRPADRIPGFIREDRVTNRSSGWLSANRVSLVEERVAPGQIGTYRFWYTVPAQFATGTYREYFRPVADGITWMEDMGIYWDVTVRTSTYDAAFVSQNAHPSLAQGQSYQFEVQLRNTGTATWQRGRVNLGTDRPADRLPVFGQPAGWMTQNRVILVESSVAPGQLGTFRFTYTVPSNLAAGTYREYFRPVADGIGWLNDLGIYWDVTVLAPVVSVPGSGASASASASAGGASASASASASSGGSAAAASAAHAN